MVQDVKKAAEAASEPSKAEPQRPAPLSGVGGFMPAQGKVPAGPPPLPSPSSGGGNGKSYKAPPPPREPPKVLSPDSETGSRRQARRRAAGPARTQLAANDDTPSIGGLIYALERKPSSRPFVFAGIASTVWVLIAAVFLWSFISSEAEQGVTFGAILAKPAAFLTLAGVVVPVAVLWFLALLVWRSEELRLRSSTMTEVAVRLAEPDRMAEQSVASLGQAVRRQVAFMNDAVSRALGRAGELEALVHNEVSALERSYEENERKIRSLIQELAGERVAIVNTSGQVSETLRQLGSDVPALIDKLSNQQIKLAQIIQGAGENLTALETAVGQSAQKLETTLGMRTEELQAVLIGQTSQLGSTMDARTQEMQVILEAYTMALGAALGSRTEQIQGVLEQRTDNLQTVFEEYARALDTTFSNQAQAFDSSLVDRTRALDNTFSERLRLFDESIKTSTQAIDAAVTDKALALTSALDQHARNFNETVTRQTMNIDDSLMQGISSVRRTSENITRQSLKAIEGLAGQSEVLRNVSENLLGQINNVTNRFENQSQGIMRAANSLESINYKIDQTLQARHSDLSQTLDRMSGKADEFGRFVEGYSTTIAGSLTDAESRARAVAHEIILGAEKTKRAALADLERFRSEADAQGQRALDELRNRFTSVSSAVSEELDTLSSRFDATTEEVRKRSQKAATEIAAEQAWLREQMERLPAATRESADAMRRALQDQLKALEQLSSLTTRTAQTRDIAPPLDLPAPRSTPRASEPTYPDRNPRSSLPPPQSEPPMRSLPPRGGQMMPPPGDPLTRTAAPPMPPARPVQTGASDASAWSLGDLLARASRDEEGHPHATPAAAPASNRIAAKPMSQVPAPVPAPSAPYQLNVDVIARALDPATTSAIWQRLRAGQRGTLVRSIYSSEGRTVFDEVSRRIKMDPDLARTVNRYLSDFERIQREAEEKDPTGRLVQNHLVSDTGRVYLFLAHASGRIA